MDGGYFTGRLATIRTANFFFDAGTKFWIVGSLSTQGVTDEMKAAYRIRTAGRLANSTTLVALDENGDRHLVDPSEIVLDEPAQPAPYEWKPQPGHSLILRTSVYALDEAGWAPTKRVVSSFTRHLPADRQFVWPTTPGSVVEASDFTTDPTCGHGLHGLEWGRGMRIMLEDEHNPDAVYQVLDVADEDIIRIPWSPMVRGITGKVKFRKGTLVYSGDFEGAAKIVADNTPKDPEAEKAIADLSAHKHRFYAMGPSGDKRLSYGEVGEPGRVETDNPSGADLISSEIAGQPGYHTIALDIDLKATLVPSGTPGNSHLYIDQRISWEKYETLLNALADAGVIEPGYAAASIRRKATFLRTPHRPKGS